MSLTNVINYDNPSSFTYDSSLVTISSSAQLTNIRPANSTFYAGYHATFNADYGNGSLTATAVGAPVLGTYYASLVGAGNYLSYPVAGNADFTQTGTVRLKYTPGYSGTPGAAQNILAISGGVSDITNLLEIQHYTDGLLYWYLFNSSASPLFVFGTAWSPVSGTEYEIEADFDITSGASRIFINGIQLGATQTVTGTRTNTASLFNIGNDYAHSSTASNFQVTDVILFNSVQHTANFASEIPRLPETKYSMAAPSVTVLAEVGMDDLNSFIETAVKPANTEIKYNILVNGAAKYWNGAAWVSSNGSYAQSNTAATINTNCTSLLPPGADIRVAALLSSTYGGATPVLTSVEEDYEFFVSPPVGPDQCILYCFLEDIIGNTNVTNAKLVVELEESEVLSGWVVGASKYLTSFDANGYVQLSLVSTLTYDLSITYTDAASIERTIVFNPAEVPVAVSVSLVSLTTIQSG